MRTTLQGETVYYGTGSGSHAADAEAAAIVFVHGAGFDHSVWVMPARYFARHGLRVFAPDLPAHGRSGGAPLESIEAMADWVAALLRQEGVKSAVAVGHSMGSLICLALGNRHPHLVDKIALLGTALPMPVGPPLLQAAADNHHAAIDMANTWSHSFAGGLGAAQVPGLSNLNSGERWLERMQPGVYHADLAACNNFYGAEGEAGQVDVGDIPTLVIAGREDRMTPARAGLQLAAEIAQAATVELAGCGHAMLSEQPNQVLDALAEFVF